MQNRELVALSLNVLESLWKCEWIKTTTTQQHWIRHEKDNSGSLHQIEGNKNSWGLCTKIASQVLSSSCTLQEIELENGRGGITTIF